jgi:hypothetical protein
MGTLHKLGLGLQDIGRQPVGNVFLISRVKKVIAEDAAGEAIVQVPD